MKPTLAIVGSARDIGLANPTEAILRLKDHFEVVEVIVIESDSIDDTLARLRQWRDKLKRRGVHMEIIREELEMLFPPHRYPWVKLRTERLAHARNTLLQRVKALEPPPDFLLVMDLDGVSDTLDGAETCLELPAGWGGCCVNQRDGYYYDIWALRTFDDWVDCDVYVPQELARDVYVYPLVSSIDQPLTRPPRPSRHNEQVV